MEHPNVGFIKYQRRKVQYWFIASENFWGSLNLSCIYEYTQRGVEVASFSLLLTKPPTPLLLLWNTLTLNERAVRFSVCLNPSIRKQVLVYNFKEFKQTNENVCIKSTIAWIQISVYNLASIKKFKMNIWLSNALLHRTKL